MRPRGPAPGAPSHEEPPVTEPSRPANAPAANDPRAAAPEGPMQEDLLRKLRAQLAAISGGLAPDDYASAWWDWYLNLAAHPERQGNLAQSAYAKALDSWEFFTRAASGQPL